jgi:hypothetical protein
MRMFGLLIWFTIGIFMVAAAQGSVTSRLSLAQAAEIAENALQAYNAGDYAVWSRDWSDAMKAAIKERDFMAFREQTSSL